MVCFFVCRTLLLVSHAIPVLSRLRHVLAWLHLPLESTRLAGYPLRAPKMYGALPFYRSRKLKPRDDEASDDKSMEAKCGDLAKLWSISFAGNFAASAAMAGAAAFCLFSPGSANASFAAALAVKKCSLPFLPTMVKGIGANWLVNLAVFQAATSGTTGGKIAAVWMPVTAFVALGLEHR